MLGGMAPRIEPGRLTQLGPLNWAMWRVLSRASGVPDAHLFSTLGQAGGLFRAWLYYSGRLMPFGRLPRHETELVILRIAHLRDCEYERQHHIRLGERAGVTPALRERVMAGPSAPEWSAKHRALLTAVDQLVATKDIDAAAWATLAAHYDARRLVEICLLATQYDGLATVIGTLRIEPDA